MDKIELIYALKDELANIDLESKLARQQYAMLAITESELLKVTESTTKRKLEVVSKIREISK